MQVEEVQIRPGVVADPHRFLLGQRTAHLGRHSRDEGPGRDERALPDDGPGRDEGPLADAGAGEHDGSHPDQAAVLDDAAVQDGAVPDRDPLAQDHVAVLVSVRDAAVLDVAARAYRDGATVRTEHAAVPHARFRPEVYVADEDRTWSDPGTGSQLGRACADRQQHRCGDHGAAAGTDASSRYQLLAVPPVTSARSAGPAPAPATASDRSLQASAYAARRSTTGQLLASISLPGPKHSRTWATYGRRTSGCHADQAVSASTPTETFSATPEHDASSATCPAQGSHPRVSRGGRARWSTTMRRSGTARASRSTAATCSGVIGTTSHTKPCAARSWKSATTSGCPSHSSGSRPMSVRNPRHMSVPARFSS